MNLTKSNKEVAQKRGGGFKVPHTLVIISAIILLVAVATYLVPGGAYEKISKNNFNYLYNNRKYWL